MSGEKYHHVQFKKMFTILKIYAYVSGKNICPFQNIIQEFKKVIHDKSRLQNLE
jgi:hypothetical protein